MNQRLFSSTLENKLAVVIDAFSTGRSYLHELRQRELRVIHVVSRKALLDVFSLPSDEVETIVCETGEDAVDLILQLNPEYLFCGSEPGIDVFGALPLSRTSRCYNPSLRSQIFSDKYAMCNVLKSLGMNVIPHALCDDAEMALAFFEIYGPKIVIKPVDSAGADGVIFCNTPDDVRSAAERLLNQTNILGRRNFNILCQKFVDGQQYIVNGMVRDGTINVYDIWRDNREDINNVRLLDFEEALSPSGEEYSRLKSYAIKCMSRLKYRNGPFHMELIVNADECHMIETGFRVMGSLSHVAYQHMFGIDLVRMHVDYVLDGISSSFKFFSDRAHLCVTLRTFKNGHLTSDLKDFCRTLKTYCGDYGLKEIGSQTTVSLSLFDNLGTVYLSGAPESVRSDYHKIREFENAAVTLDEKDLV